MQRASRAFTLIELLVVIAIIAILAAILFPVFAQAREKARAISCLSNTKQLSLAVLMYVQDYDEAYPLSMFWNGQGGTPGFAQNAYEWSSQRAIQPYIKNTAIYICPDDSFSGSGYASIRAEGFPANIPLTGISYFGNALTPSITGAMYGQTNPRGLFIGSAFYGTNDGATTLGAVPAPANIVMLADGRDQYVTNFYGCGPWLNDEIDWCYGDGEDIMWNWELPLFLYSVPTDSTYTVFRKHTGGTNIAFADGHSKFERPGNLDNADAWMVNPIVPE